MLSISNNLVEFKKGVLDTTTLFKTMFKNESNIILSKDNKNYINNISQLLELKTYNNTAYNFGMNFTLTQIKNFRENLCINPILYILAFEHLIENLTNFKDLEKYDFQKVVAFLQWYYKESELSKAIITKENIKKLFQKESQDKFLNKVIDESCKPCNIDIVESKENKLFRHTFYRIKARYISGDIIGNNYKIFIANSLDADLFAKLSLLRIPILLLYSQSNFIPDYTYNITAVEVPISTICKHYNDICLLTGFGKGYQNLDINEFNNLSFGEVKEFKILDGELLFSSNVNFTQKEVELMNIKDKYSYYALQGKNLTIETTEEYLEKVKCLVSTIKTLKDNGIFYTETKTLKILTYFFENKDSNLSIFLDNLLQYFLSIFNLDYKIIEEVRNNKDLKVSFNPKTGKYEEDIFTSLDYYLNLFKLLDSNIKTLKNLA